MIVTPNLPEAARLLDEPVATDRADDGGAGRTAARSGAQAVLIKGGHAGGAESADFLLTAGRAALADGAAASPPRTPTAPAARCPRRSPPASPAGATWRAR